MGVRAKPVTWEVNENGCHIVTSHFINPGGYAMVWRDGKMLRLHRVVYEEKSGKKLAKGMVVRHSCDEPSCVNPGHLSEGTVQDNVDDMVRRNRVNTKISECDAKMIKYFYEGWRHRDIGEIYSINQQQVSRIRSGERWKHI